MRGAAFLWALLAIPVASGAQGASLTVSDGVCEYRIAYNPTRVDGPRLEATFGYLNDGAAAVELAPTFATAEEIAAIDVADYRGKCAAHRKRLSGLAFIDLPGLEDLRKRELKVLDESCRLTEASLAAAKGDAKPMRAVAPACRRYVDLLDLPAKDLKTRWNDLVVDLCQNSTEQNHCAGQLQRDGEGLGSQARRRIAVVTRWGECAASKTLNDARQADAAGDRERRRLKDLLAKRFRAKTLSCAQ